MTLASIPAQPPTLQAATAETSLSTCTVSAPTLTHHQDSYPPLLSLPPSDPPSITQSPDSQTVHLTSPVLFQCTADGNPAPLITWNFQGSPIAGVQGGNLTVPSAGAADVGTYTCLASNLVGVASADASLTVLCES